MVRTVYFCGDMTVLCWGKRHKSIKSAYIILCIPDEYDDMNVDIFIKHVRIGSTLYNLGISNSLRILTYPDELKKFEVDYNVELASFSVDKSDLVIRDEFEEDINMNSVSHIKAERVSEIKRSYISRGIFKVDVDGTLMYYDTTTPNLKVVSGLTINDGSLNIVGATGCISDFLMDNNSIAFCKGMILRENSSIECSITDYGLGTIVGIYRSIHGTYIHTDDGKLYLIEHGGHVISSINGVISTTFDVMSRKVSIKSAHTME